MLRAAHSHAQHCTTSTWKSWDWNPRPLTLRFSGFFQSRDDGNQDLERIKATSPMENRQWDVRIVCKSVKGFRLIFEARILRTKWKLEE